MSTLAEAPETGELPETDEPVEAPEAPEEPETGDEPDEEPAEPEAPAAAAAEPLSERQLTAAFEKLAREGKRHRDRLGEIMGEESLLLEPCPLCTPEMAGWRFPVQPDDETRNLVRQAIGDASDLDYDKATFANTCPDCKGLGQVLTGSSVPDRRTTNCRRCNGWGYVTIDGPAAPTPGSVDVFERPPAEYTPENAPPDTDFMGRKRGDLNFGVLAGYER